MHALLIHGGAGRIPRDLWDDYLAGLRAALLAGGAVLEAGGSALDAICTTVATMEDDPLAFNAGTGSAPTSQGTVECDAAVMTGDGRAGAVACVSTSRNPVRLARRVLEASPHVLLVGSGAESFETNPVPNASLLTDRARAAWERWNRQQAEPEGTATCGAAALDQRGKLAAATSTGGVLGQWPGRVGDAPIPGAGTWADAGVAIGCTGRGEAFLTTAAARTLALDLERGAEPEVAVAARLTAVRAAGGEGGLIALARDGTMLVGYDTPNLAWGRCTPYGESWEVGEVPAVRRFAPMLGT